jgi:hypothetical protein
VKDVNTPRRAVVAILAATGLTAVACVAGSSLESGSAEPVNRAFNGTHLTMDLSAGGYVIRGTEDHRIRVSWTTRDARDARNVRVRAETAGSAGRIETDGHSDGFHAEIEIPARCDLVVRLTAGDLLVSGIEGHKDIAANAGNVRVGIQKATAYRSVRTFVLAGEIRAEPFGGSKGGIFRQFNWHGKGTYDLRAKLLAGDLTLGYDAIVDAENQR